MKPINYDIETYGCKVNSYDSGLLQKRLAMGGYVRDAKTPSVHILNTCAVTEEATKEALRRIRRLKAKNPLSTVVVTGCGAQVDTEKFDAYPGADLVVANSHKGQLEDLIKKHMRGELRQKVFKSNIFKKLDLEAGGGKEQSHTRSFLKIQDGCNSFCTFCVIPFARGKSRSISIDEIVNRVNVLFEESVREVVITGVHIGDYQDDFFGENNIRGLEDLLEQLLLRTRMPRFRISSLEPPELSTRLLNLFKDERICPHFHMSIQSANTKVLAEMKRKYTAENVQECLNRIGVEVPGAFVGMDVIVGFPGETPTEFQDTLERLKDSYWTKIHVFPYSERPGTWANKLPGKLYRSEIMDRAKVLRQVSQDRYTQAALEQVGKIKKVILLNGQNPLNQQVLSQDYWNIQMPQDQLLDGLGEEFEIKVMGFDPSHQSRLEGCHWGERIN